MKPIWHNLYCIKCYRNKGWLFRNVIFHVSDVMLANQVHAVISLCEICAQTHRRTDMVLVLITLLHVFLSLFSGRSVTLAGCEAVWTGVRQRVAAAVLFNPVQRGECYSVSRSGCPLRHHQFPCLQISPAGSTKNRRGPPLQVSPTLSLCLSPRMYWAMNLFIDSHGFSFQGLSGGGDRSVCRSDQ